MKKDNREQSLYALISASVLDAPVLSIGQAYDETEDELYIEKINAVADRVSEALSAYGDIKRLPMDDSNGEVVAFHLGIDGQSPILDRSVGLTLDYSILEHVIDTVYELEHISIQIIATLVYSNQSDVSLAWEELTSLGEHALLLNITDRIYPSDRRSERDIFPDEKHSIGKLDLEKLFFNSIITLDFKSACDYFMRILDYELQFPATAVSIKPRTCDRLAWIIYVLGNPPKYGIENPIEHNIMKDITEIDSCESLEQLRERVRGVFLELEKDYCVAPPQTKLQQITEYIRENYQNCNLDATTLCELFSITPPSLSRMFRREFGSTMLDYIHTVRLGHIKRMMMETDLPLQEISTACGYYSSWTMSRVFRKYEGISPGEYRKTVFNK